nr:transposase [Azospirillum aestuarii]
MSCCPPRLPPHERHRQLVGADHDDRRNGDHLCVDAASSTIVGAVLTTTEAGDASQVGPLLAQTHGPITTVLADGAYDGEPIYQTIAQHDPGAVVIIPPRATAGPAIRPRPPRRRATTTFSGLLRMVG